MGTSISKKNAGNNFSLSTICENCSNTESLEMHSCCSFNCSQNRSNFNDQWSKVTSQLLNPWRYEAVLWGFDPRIDYMSNVKGRLQPWCTSGRYFVVTNEPPQKIIQRPYCLMTITENCLDHVTHIRLPYAYVKRLYIEPEPAGHYLKSAQVVGYKSGIAIIQLNCTDSVMEFVVVHMKTDSILAIHKESTLTGKHYLCDCVISPDLSSFILKPNAMFVLNFCRSEFKNNMKVLSLKENKCPVIKSIFPDLAVRLFVAYDPRYCWSRVAFGNYSKFGKDVLCVYDIKEEKILLESTRSVYQTTHNILYSPDGRYIVSLILGRSIKDGLFNFPNCLIYSSDTLEIIHSIKTLNLSEIPTLSPAAIFPIFSETGDRLAMAFGEPGPFYQQVVGVHIYKVPSAMDLQSLCREVIRRRFHCQDIPNLPLPSLLRSYLTFKPYME